MTRRGAVEVGFVLIGFYAFFAATNTLWVYIMLGWPDWTRLGVLGAVKSLIALLLPCAFGCGLIAYRRKLAGRFFPEEEEEAGLARTDWQDPAYRLSFTIIGVLTLIRWIPSAFTSLVVFLDFMRVAEARIFPGSSFEDVLPFHWRALFASAATLAVGVYLLLGAPGLREWLVKRARGDGKPPAPEPSGEGNG